MRIYSMPQKRFRWFAGGAVAVSTLAIVMGLMPTALAQTGSPADATAAGSASAVAAPRSSICRWEPTPANIWVTDPTNVIGIIGGNYNRPGSKGVAYKATGRFAHSTTMSFTAYNSLVDIESPASVLTDTNIIPDPGSVNPFVPGTRVEAPNRNYTVWFWPDGIPVPAGLKNVVLYPTKPETPPGGNPRWSLTIRLYHMQPGYSGIKAFPKITAVSAANPSKPVRCPLHVVGTFAQQVHSFVAHLKKWGPILAPPEPTTGNKIYFTRIPAAFFLGLDGYPGPLPYGCAQYLVATLPLNKISVTTMHQVPTYFNNDLVTPLTIMKNYQIRYQSLAVNYFTLNGKLYRSLFINTDDSLYTADGSWVTVFLPSEPRLPPALDKAVRAVARAHHYNVIQLPPKATGPLGSKIPDGTIAFRQKGISPSFRYSNTAMPCWSENHPYKTYPDQTSPAFFAKYASSPKYNGPYYADGFKLTFPQFMATFSRK
jgi:hypothetical protein